MANKNVNSQFTNTSKEFSNQSSKGKNSSKNGNRNRRPSRNKAFSDVESTEYAAENKCNDSSWYIPTDQNVKDVANFSYNTILGYDTNNANIYTIDSIESQTERVIPGIATYFMLPTVGISTDETSAMNIAAVDLYGSIRRHISGSRSYDPSDLMQVIIGIASCYSALNWAFRIYGLCNTYSSQNRYIPRYLVQAQKVNFDDVLAHMADFRSTLNRLALQIASINVPKNIPLFDRWWHIYDKIYADSNTPQAQIYLCAPSGFLYREDTSGSLSFHQLPAFVTDKLMTVDDITTYLTQQVNSLLYSEDVGTISGDVLRAFGDSGVYRINMIEESYSVVPDLSDEIREQLENARLFCLDLSRTGFTISQDTTKKYLETNYTLSGYPTFGFYGGNKCLNFHKTSISNEDALTASRLIPGVASVTFNSNNEWDITLSSTGSEIVAQCVITTCLPNMEGKPVAVENNYIAGTIFKDQEAEGLGVSFRHLTTIAAKVSAFDWFPEVRLGRCYIPTPNANSNDYESLRYESSILDWDRYTMLSEQSIDLLNLTSTFGLFGVPRV